jgi:centromeric protein E
MGSAWCDDDGDLNQQSGIIPRACHDLFETIKTKCDGNGMVELSYLEIYNEELRDLLSDQQPAPELKIRENLQKSVESML